jgi:hypothetical protein
MFAFVCLVRSFPYVQPADEISSEPFGPITNVRGIVEHDEQLIVSDNLSNNASHRVWARRRSTCYLATGSIDFVDEFGEMFVQFGQPLNQLGVTPTKSVTEWNLFASLDDDRRHCSPTSTTTTNEPRRSLARSFDGDCRRHHVWHTGFVTHEPTTTRSSCQSVAREQRAANPIVVYDEMQQTVGNRRRHVTSTACLVHRLQSVIFIVVNAVAVVVVVVVVERCL